VVLPVSVESLQRTYCQIANNQMIACGIDQSVLYSEITQSSFEPTRLSPERVPEALPVADVADELNVLTRAFEPRTLRILRRRGLFTCAIAVLVTAILMTIGIERRTRMMIADRETIMLQVAQESTKSLQSSTMNMNVALPPRLRLVAELRQLRQSRQTTQFRTELGDCSDALALFLSKWPNQLHLQVESLSLSPKSLIVRGMT